MGLRNISNRITLNIKKKEGVLIYVFTFGLMCSIITLFFGLFGVIEFNLALFRSVVILFLTVLTSKILVKSLTKNTEIKT